MAIPKRLRSTLSNKRRVMLLVVVAFLLPILYQVFRDVYMFAVIRKDVAVVAGLIESEMAVQSTTENYCFETSFKHNTGARVCQAVLEAKENIPGELYADSDKEAWANERFEEFLKIIDSTEKFQNSAKMWRVEIPGLGSGGRFNGHKKSGLSCGAGANYSATDNMLTYRLECATTPWFSRMTSRF